MNNARATCGSERDFGCAGHQRQCDTGRRRHRRIGNGEAPRHLQEQDRDSQKRQQTFEEAHGIILSTNDGQASGKSHEIAMRARSRSYSNAGARQSSLSQEARRQKSAWRSVE